MNVYFTTYNDKGEILRMISCPADHVALQQLEEGEHALLGRADGDTQKIVEGRVVNKTKEEIQKDRKYKLHFDRLEQGEQK